MFIIVYEKRGRVIVFKNEKAFRDLGSGFLMTYTFKRRLMTTTYHLDVLIEEAVRVIRRLY